MVRKILFVALLSLVLAQVLVLPRFRKLRARVDRAVNVTLVVLALAYGFELVRFYLERADSTGP